MKVSTETIRKDLDELESYNLLNKVYGGAVKIPLEREEAPFAMREISHAQEKDAIAIAASKQVNDNDIVALDEGSTTLKMVEYIARKKNMTIVTSSLPALSLLVEMSLKGIFDGNIIIVGGRVNCRHLRVSGSISCKFMNDIYVSTAFISTEGLSLDGGVTSYDCDKAELSRRYLLSARSTYVVCDHTKLDARTTYKICDIRELTGIVCDLMPPPEWEKAFEGMGVSWVSPER
jgi:DeoR/GlpR family transcriptional regulator of sugar metabolism